MIEPIDRSFEEVVDAVANFNPKKKQEGVFTNIRTLKAPAFSVKGFEMNKRQKCDGLKLLKSLTDDSVPLVFFDPQYRTILDRQAYGNEGERQKKRVELPQMDEKAIRAFLTEIERVLIPSGHLMLWVDKFILCSGIQTLMEGMDVQLVDLVTWDKDRMGMGYRTRRHSEYLVIFQKPPVRVKGIWHVHNIPDVWREKIENRDHAHNKPVELQKRLIQAVTSQGDVVIDPAAGSYSTMDAAQGMGRHFLGCDIMG